MKEAKGVVLKNLTKKFLTQDGKEVVAVDNINLEVNPGEFITLLGPSGCGKTTTLRMIAGFETPSSGEILIGNQIVDNLTPDKRDTALVFQNYALFPHMDVYNNVAYGLKIQKKSKSEVSERVNKILDLMKMEDMIYRVPSQMSGGQQQRVSLARALVMEPGVLLFDEPLSNLDAKLRLHMRYEIRKIQQKVGITSIYVTHDQEEAMSLSDKVVVMNKGIIEQIGTPQEIYQKPINEFVANFIGAANILDAEIIEYNEGIVKINIYDKEYTVNVDKVYEARQKVRILVRPEGITIDKDDFDALVTKSVYMGDNQEYEVDFNGKIVQINNHNPFGKKTYKENEILKFGFDERSIHIF
ncbi:MAG: ABC transporter ATP-binding protein [Clostridiales bacterium]|nr:ABC transporter ATP-binding protein [Clostridiales bacterium]